MGGGEGRRGEGEEMVSWIDLASVRLFIVPTKGRFERGGGGGGGGFGEYFLERYF